MRQGNGTKPYEIETVTSAHIDMLRRVEAGNVWWDPCYHHAVKADTREGGFVRHMGGRTARFVELPQLITLWELCKAGWITPGPAPMEPQAARRARPVLLTTQGMTELRKAADAEEGLEKTT